MIRFQHKHALALLLGLMLGVLFLSVHLNRTYYREHAPFFDSCSYANQMAEVADLTRKDGLASGLRIALAGNVALVFIETVAAAPFVHPDRTFGIWLQWIWLAALAFSLYWYLARYRGVKPLAAVCLVLPFVSFTRIYDWNGGLQDLRMDLSLYIFTSLTAVWFLVTYETEARWPWVLTGAFAGLACLGRATAPVYLAMMLGPLVAMKFITGGKRRRLAENLGIMGIPVAIAAAMFLVYNFRYLYFYYVEWSPDANRHLPLRESSMHFLAAGYHLGMLGASIGAFALFVQLSARLKPRFADVDWRVLWLAAAAPLFLALRGAGLNGFVSMPAVLGMLLFSFAPFRNGAILPARRRLRVLVCALACGVALAGAIPAARGQFLSGTSPTSMPALVDLLTRIAHEGEQRPGKVVRYVMPVLGEMHDCSVHNVLRFELGAKSTGGGFVTPAGVTIAYPREDIFTASDQFLWEHYMPNRTEEQRMRMLVDTAMNEADVVVLPTDPALAFLEQNRSYNLINLKTREIRSRLLATGKWEAMGRPIQFTEHEEYQPYRHR